MNDCSADDRSAQDPIVVIGAGIVGASIAYNLASKGAAVTLLEQSTPATAATSQSFAWINAHAPSNADYFRLRLASIEEYHRLETALQGAFAVKWGGSLYWEVEGNELHREAAQLGEFGYPARVIRQNRFAELAPEVANPPADSIHFELEGAVDPVSMTQALIGAAVGHGATTIYGCRVDGFSKTGGRVDAVETSFGRIPASSVVVAAGTFAQSLLAGVGIRLPMDNRKGIIIRTLAVKPFLDHLILAPELHFRQDLDGSLLVGENFSGHYSGSNPVDVAGTLMQRLRARLPNVSGLKLGRITLGQRPVPLDGYPAVGWIDDGHSLYVASMHSGVTLAPIVGKIVSEELLAGIAADLLAPFRPTRFN